MAHTMELLACKRASVFLFLLSERVSLLNYEKKEKSEVYGGSLLFLQLAAFPELKERDERKT